MRTPAGPSPRLQIRDPRERGLVAAADRVLAAGAALGRPFRRRRDSHPPQRILLLRLERIGDLLMALPAIGDVRTLAPRATIDLVVGSWNRDLAGAITAVTSVETMDATWLAREGGGSGLAALLMAARRWRRQRYDLAINFEPDVRSNLLLAAAGARSTAGYRSGGGGPLLDIALEYDVRAHTADNARNLVTAAFGRAPGDTQAPALALPAFAHSAATLRLGGAPGPLVGVHVSGGRAIKQWDPERFAEVARRLVETAGATIVLTGSPGDRILVDRVAAALPRRRVIDAADLDLLSAAAVLQRLDLLVTGDTGPMHLAGAVGTPVVAVFGPSDPARYGPGGANDRIVRVDLPCSPCNRIRRPPARCTGHTPDCLALISADSVFNAAMAVLDARRERLPSRSAAV
ncbi:MAG: glycosyltransferase family 9 protein [Acidobacteriota bacterium]|nr:glycosyltransferase family 9 protein [Acidobacteriota bacterium]